MWDQIEKLLLVDKSGSVVFQEIIRQGGLASDFNDVGLPELLIS